jgi:hypothetical protein
MMATKKTKDEKKYPVCDGCGYEIICIPEVPEPRFCLRIRHPDLEIGRNGPEFDAGAFCLGCVTEMAKLGLRIWPVPEGYLEKRKKKESP